MVEVLQISETLSNIYSSLYENFNDYTTRVYIKTSERGRTQMMGPLNVLERAYERTLQYLKKDVCKGLRQTHERIATDKSILHYLRSGFEAITTDRMALATDEKVPCDSTVVLASGLTKTFR